MDVIGAALVSGVGWTKVPNPLLLRFEQSGNDDRDGFGFVVGESITGHRFQFPHGTAPLISRVVMGAEFHQNPYRLGIAPSHPLSA